MKNLLIIVVLAWVPVAGWGQVMNGMDIGQMPTVRYMEVVVSPSATFSKSFFAKADFGQGLKVGEHGFQEDGKHKEFKSPVHVLNWLNEFGWGLVRDWEDRDVRHFLVERVAAESK